MSNARFFVGAGIENQESRQRTRVVGISFSLLHELAIIHDIDEELAAIKALAFTFADSPPKGFIRSTEKVRWSVSLEPFKHFYDEPIYKLTVHTTESPLSEIE